MCHQVWTTVARRHQSEVHDHVHDYVTSNLISQVQSDRAEMLVETAAVGIVHSIALFPIQTVVNILWTLVVFAFPGWSDEIAALLRRRGKATDRSGWFPYTPVEVLKIERDRQRQQQQELLSSYTPQPGALYPYRSHTVLKVPKVVARATHSSSMSHSSSSQDDTQHHQYEGCLDHPGNTMVNIRLGQFFG